MMIWQIELAGDTKHGCYLVQAVSMQAAIGKAIRHGFPDDILKPKHVEAVLEIKVQAASQVLLLEE